MRLATILAIGCAAALAPPSLLATPDFFDTDSFANGHITGATTVSSIFDFRTGGDPTDPDPLLPDDKLGYNPATQTVSGVELSVQATARTADLQSISVNLDGVVVALTFSGGTTFGGTLNSAQTTGLIAAAQDGRVNYTISGGPDFDVSYAFLGITAGAKGVPETGSTLALLGFALTGLGLARRKLA